ncbi:MAG: periplasmic heavy metal sensor [Alphaproteobacteria bacterium]
MTRTEKRLTIGLVISVGLNLLIVGFLVAVSIGFHHGRGPEFAIDRIADHLEPESREILKASVAENKDEVRARFRAMRQAHRQAADVMSAEPLDQAALEQAFADARAAQNELVEAMHGIVVESAAQMSYEDRVKLSKAGHRIVRRLMGGGRHRHGPHGPGFHREGDGGPNRPPPSEPLPANP